MLYAIELPVWCMHNKLSKFIKANLKVSLEENGDKKCLHVFLNLSILKTSSNQTLGSVKCICWVGNSLTLSRHPYEAFSIWTHMKNIFKTHLKNTKFKAEKKKFSPVPLENATTEGVVLDPSAFSITLACLPSMTATQELVVPRSIPITAPLTPSDLW